VAQRQVTAQEAKEMVSILRAECLSGGVFDPNACAIDVDALLQGFLRGARKFGAELRTEARVMALQRDRGCWRAQTADGTFGAPVLINAAGAWAGVVAQLADATQIPLSPLKRTALIVDPPSLTKIGSWPLVLDARETFYFKPDAGRLLISPVDETPSVPMDAYPEELDVALAIDRVQAVADLPVRRVIRSWAGLRTFSPDRTPIVGFDPSADGFFWLAGQGGYGLQTSAAMGSLAAALIRGDAPAEDLTREGVRPEALDPVRFG
jgi:D-arginine dehydrogenase